MFEEIFSWILETAFDMGYVKPETVFIDSTHIKVNANKKKYHKTLARKAVCIYDEILHEEINSDRELNRKKPLKDNEAEPPPCQTIKSDVNPDCGLFHKGEHKVVMAYSAHTSCDKNNFILAVDITEGNINDSTAFDSIYAKTVERFPEVKAVTMDAGYKTPWICKKVTDDGRIPSLPYKRPSGKKGFLRTYDYVYDEYYNCVICPNDRVLPYITTNKEGYREFKSNPEDCRECGYRYKCTQSREFQKTVHKHIWNDYIEMVEDIRHSPIGKESYAKRSQTIERVFADAKEKHGMRYTYYKDFEQATNWVRLKFACMNLKKLALWKWKSCYKNFYITKYICLIRKPCCFIFIQQGSLTV